MLMVLSKVNILCLLNGCGLMDEKVNRFLKHNNNILFLIQIGLDDKYRWNIVENILTNINDTYWCNNMNSCSGDKEFNDVVLNIICQSNNGAFQTCLTSRRQSEPGPFVCKRTLRENESKLIEIHLDD